jgi:hypothetical protein
MTCRINSKAKSLINTHKLAGFVNLNFIVLKQNCIISLQPWTSRTVFFVKAR